MNGSKVLKLSRRLLALFCAFALLLTSVDGRIYASDPAEKESSSVEEVANKPLSVVEAKKIENNKECTVEGYIVGSLISGNLVDPAASQSAFNLALADARNEKNPDKIMPIYLADSNFMKILNVKDHPENLGKRIKLTGKRQPYFKQPGLILITAYEFVNDPTPDNSNMKVTYKYWGQTTTEDVVKGSKPTSVPAAKNPHKATQSTWSTIVGWHVEGSNEKVDPAQTVINQDTVFVAETINKDELRVINQSYFRSGMAQYTGLVNPEIYEGFAPRVLSALNSTAMTQAQVNALVQEFRDLQKKEILGNNIRIDLVDENKKVIDDKATVEIRQGDKLLDTLEITNGSMTTQKKYPNGEYTLTETKAPAGYSFAQNESITIDVSGALAYQQAPSVRLIHAGQTMATFSYENAPEGMKAPANMTPEDGKVILPEPEASSDPEQSFLFWKDPAGNTFQPGAEVEVKETTNFVGVWGKNYWKIVLNLRYVNGERITDKEIEDLGLTFKVVGSDGVAHDPWEVKSSLDTVTFFKDADDRYYFIRGDYKIIVDDSQSDYEVKEALFEEKPFDLKKDLVSVPGKDSLTDTSTQALEVRIQKKEIGLVPVMVEVREEGKRVDSVDFQLQVNVDGVWTDLDEDFHYNAYKQGGFDHPLMEGNYRLKAKGIPSGKKLVLQGSPMNQAKEITGLKDTFSLIVNEENKGSMSGIWAMFDLVADGSDHGNDPSNPNNPGTDPGNSDYPGAEPGMVQPSDPTNETNAGTSETAGKPGKANPEKDIKETYIRFRYGGYMDANGETEKVLKCKVGDTIVIPEGPIREGWTFLYWKGSKYYPGDKYLVKGDHDFTAIWAKTGSGEDDKKPGQTIASKNHGSGSPSTGDFSLVTVAGLGLLAACGLVILNKKKEVR
ncbi:MAG: DUF6359 domain-containing protein [Firmicutes bacterium]|nr:DUF6359 domain-containing protein [Bacillota bacterium]